MGGCVQTAHPPLLNKERKYETYIYTRTWSPQKLRAATCRQTGITIRNREIEKKACFFWRGVPGAGRAALRPNASAHMRKPWPCKSSFHIAFSVGFVFASHVVGEDGGPYGLDLALVAKYSLFFSRSMCVEMAFC